MADSDNGSGAIINMEQDVPNGDSDRESYDSINMGPDANGAALLEEQGMHSLQPVSGTFTPRGNAIESLLISGTSDESTSSLPSHSQCIETQANTIAPQIADSISNRSSENLPVSYQSGSHQNSQENEGEQVITAENDEQEDVDDQPSADAGPVLVEEHPYYQIDISLSGTNPNLNTFNASCSEIMPQWQLEQNSYMYVREGNLDISEIVRLFEMPETYQRQQLLNTLMQTDGNIYRPNIVQRGGDVVLLRTLYSLTGCINDHPQSLRSECEGVLFNSQDQLYPTNGYFYLGNEFFESSRPRRFNDRTYTCHLAENETSQFVTKEYTLKEWHKDQMLILLMFRNSIMVRPLGITWDNHGIRLFFPFKEGRTLTDVVNTHRQLTKQEVYLLTYEMIKYLQLIDSRKILNRNIHPDHLIICQQTRTLHMIGLSGICEVNNGNIWIPPNLSYHCAPELARGEEHDIKSDVFSIGVTMLSALTGIIPYFGATGTQRTRENYMYRIASDQYSARSALERLEFNRLIEILLKMTDNDVSQRLTPDELLSTYFIDEANIPRWSNSSLFGPRHEVNFDGCQWMNVLSSAAVNILSRDDSHLDQTNVVGTERPRPRPSYAHSVDSGRMTGDNDNCLIIVEENGREVALFQLPWTSHGREVYKKVQEMVPIPGSVTLTYESGTMRFDTPMTSFSSAEIHLTLIRDGSEPLRNNLEHRNRTPVVQQRQQTLAENEFMHGPCILEKRDNVQRSHSVTGTLRSQVSNRDDELPSESRTERAGEVNTGTDLAGSMTQFGGDDTIGLTEASPMQSPDGADPKIGQTPIVRSGHSSTRMLPIDTRYLRQRSIGATASNDDDYDDDDDDDDDDNSSVYVSSAQFQLSEDRTEGINTEPDEGNSMDVERSDDGGDSPTDGQSVSINFDISDDVSENEQDTEMADDVLQRHHVEDFEEETDEELFEATVESTTGAADEEQEVNSEDNQDL